MVRLSSARLSPNLYQGQVDEFTTVDENSLRTSVQVDIFTEDALTWYPFETIILSPRQDIENLASDHIRLDYLDSRLMERKNTS